MTDKQRAALLKLCAGYKVNFYATDYSPAFDLPDGWVAGWIGGTNQTIYVGVSPEGEVSS